MSDEISIRRATAADHEVLGEIMFDAVRNGPSLYTPEQQAAWVPEPRKGADWDARLSAQCVFVAEADGRPIGVMTLAMPDYVDLAFVRPDWQGRGIFRRLHEALETEARARGLARLHTHASLMAQPAFGAVGYSVLEPETVEIRGQSFKRFSMERTL